MLADIAAQAGAPAALIMALEQLSRLLRAGGAPTAMRATGLAIHYEIARATTSRELTRLYEDLAEPLSALVAPSRRFPRNVVWVAAREHLAIGTAITGRDAAQATHLMQVHLARAFRTHDNAQAGRC